MKIYTCAKENSNKGSIVSVSLHGVKDQVYFYKTYKLQTSDLASAHVLGIKSAMIFVENNKPIYADNGYELYGNYDSELHKRIVEKLTADEFIDSHFIKSANYISNIEQVDYSNRNFVLPLSQVDIALRNERVR